MNENEPFSGQTLLPLCGAIRGWKGVVRVGQLLAHPARKLIRAKTVSSSLNAPRLAHALSWELRQTSG